MEDTFPQIKSTASLFTGMERFSVVEKNRGSQRGEMLDKFLARLNPSRVAAGYKPLSHARIAVLVSHIPTEDLYAFYKQCEASQLPFSAYFHWAIKAK